MEETICSNEQIWLRRIGKNTVPSQTHYVLDIQTIIVQELPDTTGRSQIH